MLGSFAKSRSPEIPRTKIAPELTKHSSERPVLGFQLVRWRWRLRLRISLVVLGTRLIECQSVLHSYVKWVLARAYRCPWEALVSAYMLCPTGAHKVESYHIQEV